MQVPKFEGLSPKKLAAKNMQNLGLFYTAADFNCEYFWNESRYPKSARRDRERFLLRLAKEVWWT